jgi:hypothetical protein
MSLIQEALEKAAKNPVSPAPQVNTPSPILESIRNEEKIVKRLSRPKYEKVLKAPAPANTGKIIFAAAAAGLLMLGLFLIS